MNLNNDNIASWPAAAREFLDRWLDNSDFIEVQTSGSTGTPKKIRLLKEDMRRSALVTNEFFNIGSDSILACPLSPEYIAAKMMVVRSVMSGANLWFETPSAKPLTDFDGPQIDLLAIVPYQSEGLKQRLADSSRSLKIKQIIVGGAPLTPGQMQILEDLPSHVYATYGMTETSSHVALLDISAGHVLYKALPGHTFANDDRGCLVITNPERSWSPIVTNDIAEVTDSQQFALFGRIDHIINSGGVKVIPETVEERIRHHWPDLDCYVTSRPHPELGSEVVLVVDNAAELPSDFSLESMREKAGILLPCKYWLPRAIIRRPIHRTPNGKLRRDPIQ